MSEKMRARHVVFGVKDVPDNDFYRENGWVPVDPETPTTEQVQRGLLNDARRGYLNDRPAAEVVAAMESLPDDAKADVVAAERAGKARKTVIEAAE